MTSLAVSPNKFAKLPGITRSLNALSRITQKELLVIQKFARKAYLGANLLVAVEKADLVIHNGVTMARKMAETIQAYEKYVGRTLTKLETIDTVRKVEQRLAPVTKGIGRGIKNFYVTSKGEVIPSPRNEFNKNLSKMTKTGEKYYGTDSKGPIRVRVEKAHPENPTFSGPRKLDHTVDHVHIERRQNITSGQWGKDKTTIPQSMLE